jgi:hypothetical protein
MIQFLNVKNVFTAQHLITEYFKLMKCINVKVKVKGTGKSDPVTMAQRVGRGIALLFHDRSTRRG